MNSVVIVNVKRSDEHNTSFLAKNLLNIELPDDHKGTFTHQLSTKYYTATLEFSTYHEEINTTDQQSINTPHAIIVSFDHQNDNVFELVQKTIQSLKELYEAEVCLCVSLRQEDESSEPLLKKLNELCIDEQFELVRYSGESEDEKYGGDRVIEALQSTMWPNMGKPVVVTDTRSKQQQAENLITIHEETQSAELAQLLHDIVGDEDNSGNNESEMMKFDELLSSMLTLRRTGHTMSDEDRKKRAADLATSLFSMLGEDEL